MPEPQKNLVKSMSTIFAEQGAADARVDPAAANARAAVDDTQRWISEAARVVRRAASGDLEARILNIDAAGDLAEMLHGVNHLLDMTDAFVRESRAALRYASEGKFFRRVLLPGMLGSFRHAAQSINSASEAMQSQTAALQAAEARRQELAGSFESTQRVVDGLTRASEQIGSISKVIGAITAQTDMLALNAAIEAARVGDAGRGFAVVATEVKKLASRTADATRQIETQLSAIRDAASETAQSIEHIWSVLRSDSQAAARAAP